MPDALLGPSYISTTDFKTRAASFGVGGVILSLYSDPDIDAACASASRAIEGYLNRDYNINPQTERLQVDFTTRRIRVGKPPVASVTSAQLETYPTPTTIDVAQLVVNNQENYIEIPTSALGNYNPQTYSGFPGVEYPDVTITYTSALTLPPQAVISATGYTAAQIILDDYKNRLIPFGLSSIEDEEQSVTRAPFVPEIKAIPELARQQINKLVKVTPKNYPSRQTRGRWW